MIFKLFQKALAPGRKTSAEFSKVQSQLDAHMGRIDFDVHDRSFAQKVAVFVISNLGPMAEQLNVIRTSESGPNLRNPSASLDVMAALYIMICLGTNYLYGETLPEGAKRTDAEREDLSECMELAFSMLFGDNDVFDGQSDKIQAYGTAVYADLRSDMPNLIKTMYACWGSLFWDNDMSVQSTIMRGLQDITKYSENIS